MPRKQPEVKVKSRRVITAREKDREVAWVVEQLRKRYVTFRMAETNLQTAEQNNRGGKDLRELVALFNSAQFCLEFCLGVKIPDARLAAAEDLRWVTPEMKALRARTITDETMPSRPTLLFLEKGDTLFIDGNEFEIAYVDSRSTYMHLKRPGS